MIMKDKELKRTLGVLFLVVATELIGFGLIIPILPQIAAKTQANGMLLGVLLGAYSFAQFFSAPLLGRLSDRFGRKPILVLSKLGTVMAYIVFAFTQQYLWILVSRLIDGFTGGNITVARAYVADVTTPENRSKGMAVIGIAFGTGFILGPALGGWLYQPQWGHMLAAFVAAGMSLLAAFLTVIMLKEPQRDVSIGSSFWSGISHVSFGPIAVILVTLLSMMVMFSGFETSFSVFTQQILSFTERDNSWLFVYIGLFAFVVQGSISRIKTTRHKPIILAGLCIMGAAFGLMSFTRTLPMLLVALAILALGFGLLNTFMPALLSLHCDSSNRGTIMGVYEGVSSLSRILGPFLIYSVFATSFKLGYFIFLVIFLITLIFFWVSYRVNSQQSNDSTITDKKEGVKI